MCELLETPPQMMLHRSITEPVRDLEYGLLMPPSPPLDVDLTTTPPPPSHHCLDWKIGEKNTFLSIQTPQQPRLLRSTTDPMRACADPRRACPSELCSGECECFEEATTASDDGSDGSQDSGTFPRPPPPPPLEFFATEDHYGPAANWALASEDLQRPPGLPAPAPLQLEFVETEDPFRSTPAAAESLGLPMPPMLTLEYIATDDPFRSTTPTGSAPAYIFRDSEGKNDCFSRDEYVGAPWVDMSTPPGLAAPPPPLALESYDTEDHFEDPLQLAYMQTSEPAFVALPSMPARCGPPPPPMFAAPILIGGQVDSPPPPPPPAMPLMAAPTLDAPVSHDVPMAQPGQTPGAGIKALLSTELQSTGVLARPATASGCTHVHWAVSARKLDGQDKQAVSQVFMVELPGHGPTPFKLVIYPKATNDGKHGAGFKKAKGKGRIVLKCEAQLEEDLADVSFRIGVGRAGQEFRGPETGNFFHFSNHGLSKCDEEWDFAASVDDSRMFVVTAEIAPAAALTNNPSIWWEDVELSA